MTDSLNREIDDLLRHIEERERRSVSRRFQRWLDSVSHSCTRGLASFLRRSPVEQFMIASVALVVLSFVLQYVARSLAVYAAGLSVLMFVLALAMSLMSPHRGGRYEKRWRGRIIDYGRPTIWSQLRRWFQRRH